LLSLGGLVAYTSSRGPAAPTQRVVSEQSKAEDPPRPTPEPRAKHDMIEVAGGEFMMGRNDVSVETASPYDLNQWPAHRVRVEGFSVDRTEVTNEEYAEFVRDTGYQSPEGWGGNTPPPGQEKWPVRNVSQHDAERFAQWRSRRDGVQYRLPTEAEWEFAARAGGKYKLYPWGDRWVDGGANVESESPGDAGSRRGGADDSVPADMIGNVWEWTSTVVSLYPGNRYLAIPPGQKNDIVVRGGSYQSKAGGGEAITAMRRQWVPPSTRQPHIGFRLVHDGTYAPAGGPPQG
jgi:formylglycine-generating enzyme required for sulfatase activity